jgi:hypothetical protein
MKGIELPIYFHNDLTDQLEDLDLEFHITQCELKKMFFYRVDAVSPRVESDGYEYSIIHLGKENFSCALTYEDLIDRLKIL